jgi:excisionase family DNA binding protein
LSVGVAGTVQKRNSTVKNPRRKRKVKQARPDVQRLAYRPEEAAEAIGVSLRKIMELIASGRLESSKVDRCRRITPEALAKLIHGGEVA